MSGRSRDVLDTHALLWWALDPERLSQTALATIEEMERRGGLASAISIWELGVKVQRGKLELDRVIVATALANGVPILTKDEAIQSFDGVETVW